MTTKDLFLRIMHRQTKIALATSTYSQPNVRVVNFYYDEQENRLYFATIDKNDKIREFDINPKVAFTTLPCEGIEHVRARGVVKKSRKSFYDIEEAFLEKMPDYAELTKKSMDELSLFEIEFQSALVFRGFDEIDILEIED